MTIPFPWITVGESLCKYIQTIIYVLYICLHEHGKEKEYAPSWLFFILLCNLFFKKKPSLLNLKEHSNEVCVVANTALWFQGRERGIGEHGGLIKTWGIDLEELDTQREAFQAMENAEGKHYLEHLDSLRIFQTTSNYILKKKSKCIKIKIDVFLWLSNRLHDLALNRIIVTIRKL